MKGSTVLEFLQNKTNVMVTYIYVNRDHVTSRHWHTHLVDVFVGSVVLLPDDRLVFVEECLYSGQHRFEHRETQTEFLAREKRERLGHFKLLKKKTIRNYIYVIVSRTITMRLVEY